MSSNYSFGDFLHGLRVREALLSVLFGVGFVLCLGGLSWGIASSKTEQMRLCSQDEAIPSADLSYCNYSGSDFVGQDLSETNLRGSYLGDGDFTDAYFVRSDLRYSFLIAGVFYNSNFRSADLQGVSARYSDFRMSDFEGANLTGARFEWVDFTGANFMQANFADTNIFQADMSGTDLRNAENLTKQQLLTACIMLDKDGNKQIPKLPADLVAIGDSIPLCQ